MTGYVTAFLWATTVFGAPTGAPAVDSLVGPGPAVPFVAQGSLLCGGAAAAMLERFWGARGVYAEDYAHLVREEEGGIRTTDLARTLRERGYDVHVVQGDPGVVLEQLAEGAPAILLLGTASPPLHYVVLTASSPAEIHFHDPKLGPDRVASRADLMGRWSASGYWALLARPEPGADAPADGSTIGPAGDADSDTLHPDIVAALERVRSGDHAGARALVRPHLDGQSAAGSEGTQSAVLARRILATARFRGGDPDGALEEWNRLSEPSIDLVEIRGAAGTRHAVLAEQTGLRSGRLLTRSSLALARRRLADLPAVETSRLEYRPLRDGSVEVRGFVTEPATWPTPPTLALQGAQALLDDRAEWEVGPLLGLGERWQAHGGWSPAQRHVGASMSTPLAWLRGVATVGIEWERERYDLRTVGPVAGDAGGSAERVRGGLALRRWIAPHLRLGGGLWLERWDGARRMVSARISALSLLESGEDASVEIDLEGWAGRGAELGRASLRARVRRPHGEHRESRAWVGGTATSTAAPLTLWPGAGTGEIRAPLLRGHPLVAGDLIAGAAFAPRLLHATLEHRVFRRLGPLRFGGAGFVDAAHAWGDGRRTHPRSFVDVGLGVFAAFGAREAMVSLAAGADGPVLSARVGRWPGP